MDSVSHLTNSDFVAWGLSPSWVGHAQFRRPTTRVTVMLVSLACFSKARVLKCSSVFFFRWDLVCRSRVPSEDRGNWG